jgi:hypothetical protein
VRAPRSRSATCSSRRVTLGIAKAAGIIVISEELAKISNPSAEAVVRNDMIKGMAQYLDLQFIDPTVAAVTNVAGVDHEPRQRLRDGGHVRRQRAHGHQEGDHAADRGEQLSDLGVRDHHVGGERVRALDGRERRAVSDPRRRRAATSWASRSSPASRPAASSRSCTRRRFCSRTTAA